MWDQSGIGAKKTDLGDVVLPVVGRVPGSNREGPVARDGVEDVIVLLHTQVGLVAIVPVMWSVDGVSVIGMTSHWD